MKRNFYGTMFTGAVLASSAALIGACAHNDTLITDCKPVEQTSNVLVNVQFRNGCPASVDNDNFEVARTNRIIWQASDSDGTTPEYAIYFDPFKGHPLESKNNRGELKSPPFDSCSPQVEYKYTIVGTKCTDGPPLDPRFRLR